MCQGQIRWRRYVDPMLICTALGFATPHCGSKSDDGLDPNGAGGTNSPSTGVGGSLVPDAGTPDGSQTGGEAGDAEPKPVGEGFASDDPSHQANVNGADAGTAAAAPASEGSPADRAAKDGDSEAERAIAEADIIQIENDTLYALSQYGGLAIIDISMPEKLRMLGRQVVHASPFEMYVRSGVAYAMYSSYPKWEQRGDGNWESHVTSRIVAFDVHDPAAIRELGSFVIPGEMSDSRMVGDVIYAVSYENGSCWSCATNQPRTTVASIAIGDPAAIRKVEQLTFDDQQGSYGWYRRSISVTTNRLYVSGMVYDGSWGMGTGHSTIQVVDISDPGGKLTAGASVPVSGQIENRWEMDEYQGVLRVISQAGSTWSNGPAPAVETFKVESAQSITPLGKLTLTLPQSENLKSARFDGTRAYAVTFMQKDPLFTIDLTDPASPKQAGELEMPGYLYYMAPRGDRLVALGMDNGNTAGGLTVSVFNVEDLAHPTLLSRANFGGSWSWTPEDQDRIHKAFKIFDTAGLIAMPFGGYSYGDGGCGRYVSGVQLLDLTRDTVTTRGVVPIRGEAKRAFLHRERLFAMSDDQVASFDIGNRDSPTRLSAVALANTANKAVRVGQNIVALGNDWYTQAPQLTVVPVAGGESALPIATVDLGTVVASKQDYCYYRYWSSFSANSELFVNGNLVYVVYNGGFAGESGQVGFAVMDLTNPAQPSLAGHSLLSIGSAVQAPSGYYYPDYYYGCGIGYYYTPNGIFPSGQRIVQSGSTIALQELVPIFTDAGTRYTNPDSHAVVHAVDLANPANIRLASSTRIEDGFSSSGLFLDGSTVMTSHYEPVAAQPGKVRFYVDRIDMANLSAPTRNKINVPGSLFGVDPGGSRIVTVDYARTQSPVARNDAGYFDYSDCRNTSAFGTSWYTYRAVAVDSGLYSYTTSEPEFCVRVDRSLKLVNLADGAATLLDTLTPTGGAISGIGMGSDRLYLLSRDYSTSSYQTTIQTITGIRSGDLTPASTLSVAGYKNLTPLGTRFGLAPDWSDPNLSVYDTLVAATPAKIFSTNDIPSQYWSSSIALDPAYVIVSMGQYGVTAFALP